MALSYLSVANGRAALRLRFKFDLVDAEPLAQMLEVNAENGICMCLLTQTRFLYAHLSFVQSLNFQEFCP